MASSLILAMKKLSTMLYSAFTSIDSTIGIDIETTSGSTGFVFIKLWSIILFFLPFHIKSRTASEHKVLKLCGEKDALSKIRARSPGFCSGSC